jgi:excisionase family DNA binding protein
VTGDEWLTVADVADQLKVTAQTVQRWLRAGNLAGLNLGGKAGYRIKTTDLERFIEHRYRPEGNAAA